MIENGGELPKRKKQLVEEFANDPIIRRIYQALFLKYEKGLIEYGKPLSACEDDSYDWKNEIISELIDGMKYQQKEIIRLERLLNPSDS